MKSFLFSLYRFLASYGLACVLMLFLFLLTILGTLEQAQIGLYEAQRKYFESLILVHEFPGGIRLPLPGAYLLMVILGVNLLLGGILRFRRRSGLGMFIVHAGILFLLLGGLITHEFGIDGQMTLAPGQTASHFQSLTRWELAIVETSAPKADTEYLIPQKSFAPLTGDRRRIFIAAGLPFTLALGSYAPNAVVEPADPKGQATGEVVDGFVAHALPTDREIERNSPALYLSLIDKKTGNRRREILWSLSELPLVVESNGSVFNLSLRRERWSVPFSITLKKFTRQLHPGTAVARAYQSEIIKREPGRTPQPVTIRMNEPLRDRGYTFFQSSFFEEPRSGQTSSVLAVVHNPADQFPLYACYIITCGLLLHFGARLFGYLKNEREQQA